MKELLIALCFSMACLLVGCTTVREMTPAYHHAQERARTLDQLQLTVMRFSDEYCTRVVDGANRFQATAQTPEERLQAQRWKINQCQSVWIDATGPHPALNTLDIVVLATLSRMVIDDVTTHDERAEYLRKTHHELEESAWQLSDPLLSDAQTAQLHDIINRWRARNPVTRSVAAIHFTELAKLTGEPGPEEEHQADSLYSIVGFNPLAELDPAIQEVTQTRHLAERMIFYFQRMPNIINLQAEGFPYQIAIQPETKTLLESMQRVSLIGSAANTLASDLPSILDKEREALLRQLTQEITSQSATIGEVSGNLRSTLEAGTATANALNTMLQNLNKLTGQFTSSSLPPKTQAPPSGPPFDIRNYTEALRAATVTTEQLSALTQQLNSTLPGVRSATQGLIDHIVRQILFILAMLILGTLGAALAYRGIVIRMQRRLA
jgi:hypothetical protein